MLFRSEEADRSFLNWIAFRRINGYPVSAPVIGGGDVKVPDTLIGRLILVVSARSAAEKSEGGSIAIAGHDRWKDRALDPTLSILVAGRATQRHPDSGVPSMRKCRCTAITSTVLMALPMEPGARVALLGVTV